MVLLADGLDLMTRADCGIHVPGVCEPRRSETASGDRCRLVPFPKRGTVRRFSFASVRRFMEAFGELLHAFDGGHSLCLTYGDSFPDSAGAKRDLQTWRKRCARRFGDFAGLWGREYQDRGASHFNVALPRWLDRSAADWCAEQWLNVAGSGGSSRQWRRHYGARVTPITGAAGLGAYMAKVIGDGAKREQKQAPSGDHPGRYWGRFNPGLLADHARAPETRPVAAGSFGAEVIRDRLRAVAAAVHPEPRRALETDEDGKLWLPVRSVWHGPAAVFVWSGARRHLVKLRQEVEDVRARRKRKRQSAWAMRQAMASA